MEKFLRNFHLTKVDCSKPITNSHIEEIAWDNCKQWRILIPHLKMNKKHIEEIDKGKESEGEKSFSFFRKWKEVHGVAATYQKLISTFLSVEKSKRGAENICKLLKTATQSDDEEGSKYDNDSQDPSQALIGRDEGQTLEDPIIGPTSESLTIVLIGKTGAGKTSLMYNLLGKEIPYEYSALPQTKTIVAEVEEREFEGNNITLKVIDTVGLYGASSWQKRKILKTLSKYQDKVDIAIYCISVNLGARFPDGNPEILKTLRDVYGRNIWRHCTLVLTFSNIILENIKSRRSGNTTEYYTTLIKQYVDLFQDELKKLGSKGVKVRSYFEPRLPPPSEATSYQHIILAIPAGFASEDKVLPTQPPTEESWIDAIFKELAEKVKEPKKARALLQYRYGMEFFKRGYRTFFRMK